jgi:hypothetical protein
MNVRNFICGMVATAVDFSELCGKAELIVLVGLPHIAIPGTKLEPGHH